MKLTTASDLSDLTSLDTVLDQIRALEPATAIAKVAVADALRLAYETRYALERAYVADNRKARR